MAMLILIAVGVAAFAIVRPDVDPQPTRQQLDEPAVEACEVFEPVAARVRSGELQGQPLYRALQDVFNRGRLSQTEGFARQVSELNTAGIQGDDKALRQGVLSLQLLCQQRRG